jgi:cell division protein FtsI (penicillin-binding protein 3)
MSVSRPRGSRRQSGPSARRPRPSRPDTRRFIVVLGGIILLLSVIGARLVQLQVIAAPAYAEKAQRQRLRDVEIPPRRGTIYDREGEPLAVSVEARTVYATPYAVKDKARTAKTVATVLGLDVADVLKSLSRKSGYSYIARRVPLQHARQLEALQLAGIGFSDDSRRTYPSGPVGCQILGFVGVDATGLAGIEAQYDRILHGVAGSLDAERDPYGRPIPGGVVHSIDPVNGDAIVLTIDKDIQDRAQIELAAAVKEYKARGGSVVVMNPQSGEIYAMASVPTFDPNNLAKATAAAIRNKPVSDAYEPGSTIKSLTAASVLDKGLFTPQSKFVLPPSLQVAGRTVGEAHGRGTVTWTLTEIVTHSSNVGAVRLGQALKPRGLYTYFARFGLTEKSGIDFPGEATGWLPTPKRWSALSMANIPFGQGVSATPLQLDRAIAAIANRGILPTPHLLLSLPQDPSARLVWPKRRAISAKAAAATTSILCDVVTDGTGGGAKIPGYRVAGKTGTAQKALGGGRGYASGAYVSSFIGFLPAENPQVLISVIIDEPHGAIYGGVTAAPVFSRLGQFTVSHLGIPPSTAKRSHDASVTPATPKKRD